MPLKVLVVDDISQNISSLVEAISNKDISFVPAHSGAEALQILAQGEEFDLALLDVQMPEMDGFELARLMKGVEKTKHVPIIFITAQISSHWPEFEGYNVGAIDFIYKPVNIKMLQSKIDVFQRLKEKRMRLNEKISELEAAKKKLEISEKKAIEADLIKSAFLANMSHEIRTPITALIGFAELLEPMTRSMETVHEYVRVIHKNGKNLLELVNGILDLSKVEAGQLDLAKKDLNLFAVLEEVLLLLEPLAEQNQVTLTFEKPEVPHLLCHADPLRLRQVITNVVGNAVKFSPQGKVSLSFARESKAGIHTLLVTDSGIGIDPLNVDKLFRPFSQIKNQNGFEPQQGTGLGLSLSKKLAQLLGGDLYLKKSSVGGGSVFAIEIPVASDSLEIPSSPKIAPAGASIDSSFLKDINILIADDSPDNRLLIEAVLSQYGAQLQSVENGQEAILHTEKHQPDLILMDFKMPILDGLSATTKLRQKGYTRPVILLTANAMKGEREAALKAGATGYVSKPIDWQELLSTIHESLIDASQTH